MINQSTLRRYFRNGTAVGVLALGALSFFMSDTHSRAQTQQRGLTEAELRGKKIYVRSETASGHDIKAVIGELEVPASSLTCASCHGLTGQGTTEGNVTAGNLVWSYLARPGGHTHSTGRKHGPFDAASFSRAVTNGVDVDGQPLLSAMPRYQMSAANISDLIAYLKNIENDREPGLTDTTIKVGTLIPTRGPLGETGAAMRDVLTAYFDDVNNRGGVYNRKIELHVAETGTTATETVSNLKRLVDSDQVFALVGGVSAGADEELATLIGNERLPAVGPSTLLPQATKPVNRYLFYLLSGMREQTSALVNFAAARPELKRERIAVVAAGDNQIAKVAVEAVQAQAKKSGWSTVIPLIYSRGQFNPTQMVATAKRSGAGVVFFFGVNDDETSFLKEATAANWTPTVFLLGTLTGRGFSSSVPAGFKDRVFLAFPTVPSDVSADGMAEFSALREKYKIAQGHVASELAAFAAGKIFMEGLKRAGKDVTREKLVTALESFYEFDTGVKPRITFGPNHRVGAAGAYVITVDPEKKTFVPVSGWVNN